MLIPGNYQHIILSLKEKIRSARLRATISLNKELFLLYWEIGHTILQQQEQEGWGSKVIDKLSQELLSEFPEMRGLSVRNLKYMRAFAEAWPSFGIVQSESAQIQSIDFQDIEFVQTGLAQLSWHHHTTLLDRVKTNELRIFYARETVKNGWTRDVMLHQIEGGLHLRQGALTTNFKTTIAPEQSELVQQLFKDPYKFDFIYLGQEAKERDLEDALVNQLTKFLIELGQHFAFMGRQYRIKLGEKEYRFDLLFYHTRLKRYIVIDLKIDEFKPEYKGKMDVYLGLADDHLKDDNDASSIGLIVCKTKDRLVAEYALRDSSKPIGIAEYQIMQQLPENIKGEMPSIEELEAEIDRSYEELKSPGQKRLDGLKQKLSELKFPKAEQQVTIPIFFEIVDKSLIPFFAALLLKMEEFQDMFISHEYSWQGPNQAITDLNKLAEAWKDKDFLPKNSQLYFSYRLKGLKNAGTEAFDEGFTLMFYKENYWYGFTLPNYNNHQPILKKLYGEQLTKPEIDEVVEKIFGKVMDEIDERVERIKQDKK